GTIVLKPRGRVPGKNQCAHILGILGENLVRHRLRLLEIVGITSPTGEVDIAQLQISLRIVWIVFQKGSQYCSRAAEVLLRLIRGCQKHSGVPIPGILTNRIQEFNNRLWILLLIEIFLSALEVRLRCRWSCFPDCVSEDNTQQDGCCKNGPEK